MVTLLLMVPLLMTAGTLLVKPVSSCAIAALLAPSTSAAVVGSAPVPMSRVMLPPKIGSMTNGANAPAAAADPATSDPAATDTGEARSAPLIRLAEPTGPEDAKGPRI